MLEPTNTMDAKEMPSLPFRIMPVVWLRVLARYVSVQVVVQAIGFLSGIFVVHMLDKKEYALYTIAGTMQGALNLISDIGVSSALTAIGGKIWQDSGRLGQLVKSAVQFRWWLARFSVLVVTPVFCWMLLDHGARYLYAALIIVTILVGCFFQLQFNVYLIVPKLRAQIDRIQKLDLWGAILRLLTLLGVSLIYLNVPLALAAAALSAFVQYKILGGWVRETINLQSVANEYDRKQIAERVKQLLPTVIFYLLQGQLTIFLISFFGKTENVAEIGALTRLTAFFTLFGAVMSNIVAPYFARTQDLSMVKHLYFQITGLATIVSLFLISVSVRFPTQVLWILGPRYMDLKREVSLMVAVACLNFLINTMWALNLTKGWTKHAWLQIPLTLTIQVGLLLYIDLSNVSGVLWFGLWSGVPFFIMQFWLFQAGFQSERMALVEPL